MDRCDVTLGFPGSNTNRATYISGQEIAVRSWRIHCTEIFPVILRVSGSPGFGAGQNVDAWSAARTGLIIKVGRLAGGILLACALGGRGAYSILSNQV
jgi:hypothetical protein